MTIFNKSLIVATITACGATASWAAPIDPALPGVTDYDGWADITSANYDGYGGFPGNSDWPAPIGSNQPGSGDALLTKVNGPGGGPIPFGTTLYFGGFSNTPNTDGGSLILTDTTPVDGLKTVVFQIDFVGAFGYEFYNNVPPILRINGSTDDLIAVKSLVVSEIDVGTFPNPVTGDLEPLLRRTRLYQWDLSAIAEPITSFEIRFNAVQHTQVHALRLDQSDTVPEPATVGLLAAAGLMVLARRKV